MTKISLLEADKKTRTSYSVRFEEMVGTGFIAGAITYAITKDIRYVIGALTIAVWIMRLRTSHTEE